MAKGSNSTVPDPAETGGTYNYDTEMLVETPGNDEYTGRSVSFEEDANESGEAMEEDYDLEEKEDISEDAILAAGRGSGTISLARNLMEELDEVVGSEPAFGDDDDDEGEDDDDDSKQAVTTSQVTEQKQVIDHR
ncbi:Eukaryotic/viral aspartic protease [Phytophthora megakarya]|uniref:Eukaryotic/viral aspartic protease n=1 Tax=Phytophthora megakarya TaxID=4795 RepID=A0A225V4Q5_9STRA|nr:Eukaryotic/viral aspartic protease [Phytophthora megakarya]